MSAEEDLARLRANADQAQATLAELARMLGAFRAALVEQGFEPHEALQLCATLLAHNLSQTGEDDEP